MIREVKQIGGMYTTWTAALAAASAGDTIRGMDSATYLETITVPAIDGLTLDVDTGHTPIIETGSGDTCTIADGATNCTIRGVELKNTSTGYCVALAGDCTGLRLECTLTGQSGATACGGGAYAPGYDVVAVGCVIQATRGFWATTWARLDVSECLIEVAEHCLKANAWHGTWDRNTIYLTDSAALVAPYGIAQSYNGAIRYTNNLVVDGMTGTAYSCLTVYDDAVNAVDILGNTFVGTTPYVLASVPALAIETAAGNQPLVTIAGNIVAEFAVGMYAYDGTFRGSHNCWDCAVQYGTHTASGTGDVVADPVFVGSGSYRLDVGSPCLGASVDLGLTEDRDGAPRPAGTRWDIGAYNDADATPPRVTGATATDEYTVGVQFSEDVTGADLLAAADWHLVEVGTGDVVTIASVAADGTDAVTLSLSTGLRWGTLYRATAPSTIEDTAGNVILAGERDALFEAALALGDGSGLDWALTLDGQPWTEAIELFPATAGEPVVSLISSVLISLLTDRRARDDEAYPTQPRAERRGWWATAYDTDGEEIGSGLWLYDRGKITDTTPAEIEQLAVECLSWMVRDGLCASVSATATRAGLSTISLVVDIVASDGKNITLTFADLWAALEAING